MGTSTTTGTQQTSLAARVAPPPKRAEFGVLNLIVLIVLSPILGLIAAIVFAAFARDRDSVWPVLALLSVPPMDILFAIAQFVRNRGSAKYNREEWPLLQAVWEKTWLCHRCGEQFVPAEAAERT